MKLINYYTDYVVFHINDILSNTLITITEVYILIIQLILQCSLNSYYSVIKLNLGLIQFKNNFFKSSYFFLMGI